MSAAIWRRRALDGCGMRLKCEARGSERVVLSVLLSTDALENAEGATVPSVFVASQIETEENARPRAVNLVGSREGVPIRCD
jgi:hypothetical protein